MMGAVRMCGNGLKVHSSVGMPVMMRVMVPMLMLTGVEHEKPCKYS